MKFGPDVLIEIVSVVQKGILTQTDVSDQLRNMEMVPSKTDPMVLTLSESYLASRKDC